MKKKTLQKMYKITATISVIVLLLDQIIKGVINNYIGLNETVTVIPKFFYLTNIENAGAAWGILPNKTNFLIIFTVLALVLLYEYIRLFKKSNKNALIFGLLIGGIAGNLVDRLFAGYVRDFIGFTIFKYNFPVFNISDICIVIGAILLIIAILKGEDKSEVRSKSTTAKK